MLTEEEARNIVQRVLEESPAEGTEVILMAQASHLTRFANNTIHQNVSEEDLSLSVQVIQGKKTKRAQTNILRWRPRRAGSPPATVCQPPTLRDHSHPTW